MFVYSGVSHYNTRFKLNVKYSTDSMFFTHSVVLKLTYSLSSFPHFASYLSCYIRFLQQMFFLTVYLMLKHMLCCCLPHTSYISSYCSSWKCNLCVSLSCSSTLLTTSRKSRRWTFHFLLFAWWSQRLICFILLSNSSLGKAVCNHTFLITVECAYVKHTTIRLLLKIITSLTRFQASAAM